MEQGLMGRTEADCGEERVNLGQDTSVLILLAHCRDMKRQETRLRTVTLLLLLLLLCGAAAFSLLSRQQDHSCSSGQGNSVVQSPAYSKQQGEYPTDQNPSLHIHLHTVADGCDTADNHTIKWKPAFGGRYNEEKRAIVIPKKGFYFVYVKATIYCPEDDQNVEVFSLELRQWNPGYKKNRTAMDAQDYVSCKNQESRTVYVGQLLDLLEGDHLSVWVDAGYRLIYKAEFGAYST